jgi:nitrogen fixation NifU-like protein
MYSEKVMEHFTNPHNVGELKDANAVGEVGNARCGDIMRMYLKINNNNVIEDVSFKTFGCCAAIASSSVATDLIKGKSIDEALRLKNSDVVDALDGLPSVKVHCSVLAEEAVRQAIENYRKGVNNADSDT